MKGLMRNNALPRKTAKCANQKDQKRKNKRYN